MLLRVCALVLKLCICLHPGHLRSRWHRIAVARHGLHPTLASVHLVLVVRLLMLMRALHLTVIGMAFALEMFILLVILIHARIRSDVGRQLPYWLVVRIFWLGLLLALIGGRLTAYCVPWLLIART